jgi:hypothetical protein
MATLSVTPGRPNVGDRIVVDGAGFKPSSPVTLSIDEGGVVVKVTTSAAGGFKSDKVIDWAPSRAGIFTLVASDGTDTAEYTLQVWT